MKKLRPSKKIIKAITSEMKKIFDSWQSKLKDKTHSKVHLIGELSKDFYYCFYKDFIKLDYKAMTVIYEPGMESVVWDIDVEDKPGVNWERFLNEIRKQKKKLLNL